MSDLRVHTTTDAGNRHLVGEEDLFVVLDISNSHPIAKANKWGSMIRQNKKKQVATISPNYTFTGKHKEIVAGNDTNNTITTATVESRKDPVGGNYHFGNIRFPVCSR